MPLGVYLAFWFSLAALVPALLIVAFYESRWPEPAAGDPSVGGALAAVAVANAIAFGVVLGLVVRARIVRPLARLTAALDAVDTGDAAPQLPQTEIRELARLGTVVATRIASRNTVLESNVSRGRTARPAPTDASDLYVGVPARGANDGLWDWDLIADTLYCSPEWHAVVGVTEGGDVVRPSFWLDRVHPEDLPRLRAALDDHLRGLVDHLVCETRVRGDDGAYRRVVCRGLALRHDDGTPYRIAGSIAGLAPDRDATPRPVPYRDALTSLPARERFMERLAIAIGRRRRTDAHRLAVVLMDVDRFKVVNDSLGRALGDDLLVAISRRLEACVRDVDTIARFGGDEWTILVDDLASDDEANGLAERFRQALASPLVIGEHTVFVTISIGIALLAGEAVAPEDLVRDAEIAMHRAKELGRDRFVVFDASLHGRAVALLALEADLRVALERGELLVYYQPIVAADGLTVRGVEALVRWRHPERGLVSPAEFIGFAEDSGLILPLGDWVLGRAIEQMRDWQAAGVAPDRVSVNLSARQLHQKHLVERIAATLDRAGLDPACLELELTEGVVAERTEATIQILGRLRGLGIGLAVDDFGTGYSSLAYLTRFPVSSVKIDRAFLIDIQHDTVNQAIVQAVTTLSHSIGMRVVAEGIETAEQLELARSLGCDEVQGFLVSRPLPADEATVWLATEHSREVRRQAASAPDRRRDVS